jgi:hypothetical protein
MKKKDLIIVLDQEPDVDLLEVLRHSQMTRVQLIREIKAKIRRESRPAGPCPKGHKPDDPTCDLTCWVTNIEPFSDAPAYALAAKTRCKSEYHQRLTDNLTAAGNPDEKYIEPMAQLFRGLDAQFAADNSIGWFWRVPYGWWLKLTRRSK